MRAIEFHGAERLELVERPDPTPGAGQLLIAPSAVGICGTDVEIFEGSLAYFRMGLAEYPIVPGHEWTGVVVDVGAGVTGFSPGDRVVGEVAIGCGKCVRCRAGRQHLCARRTETGIVHMDGAMASRMVFPAAFAHRVDLDARAAALVEPTSVALHAVRRGDVAGKGVLVVGAGPIGLLVAQCARAEGAAEVVISDTRADRLEVAAALGVTTYAGEAADPAVPGEPETAGALAAGAVEPGMVGPDGIDVAILCAGGPAAIQAAFTAVRPGGRVVALGLSGSPTIPFDFDGMVVRDIDLVGVLGSVGYWPDAISLLTGGSVKTEPIVTGTFPLERTRDALEHLTSPGTLKVLIEPDA
ncbi:MAG TPA: alcohol dehydrogenase catalytic domain-containing protein [Solirubrobacter sp.]|nr:alcohol dehydrogenase catalytic domain-containing protein [Solirubrobacter sp.]